MGDDFKDSGIEDNCNNSLHGDVFEGVPEEPDFRTGTKIETAGDYLPETKSTPSTWLLEQMDDIRLESLRSHFFPNCLLQNGASQHRGRTSFRGIGLTKEQFATAVCEIIGTNVVWEQATGLHDKYAQAVPDLLVTDTNVSPDETQSRTFPRLLFWEHLVDAFLEEPPESDWTPLRIPQIFQAQHLKREPVVRVIPLQTTRSFCYVVVSRWGRVGIYDAAFNLLESYRVKLGFTPLTAKVSARQKGRDILKEDAIGYVEPTADRRRGLPWINDVVFLPDALSLIFLCSDSSLQVWSAEWLVHSRKWSVMSIPSVVLSAAYRPSETKNLDGASSTETQSLLFIGDEEGYVTTITFLQPRASLFRPKDTENNKDEFFWAELRFQTSWVRLSSEQIHSCAVNELKYFADGNIVLSTSYDPAASIVLFWPTERKAKTILKLSQGATCVTMSRPRRTIVAGCRDGSIQIWPFPPSIPPVTLRSDNRKQIGEFAIRDICFVNSYVLSVDDKGVLKLWNIQTEECIQAVNLPVATLKSLAILSLPHTPYRLFPGPSKTFSEIVPAGTFTDSTESCPEQEHNNDNSNRATGTLSPPSTDDFSAGDKSINSMENYPVDIGVSCGTGVILLPFCPPPKPPPLLPLPTEASYQLTFDDTRRKLTSPQIPRVFLRPPDPLPQPGCPSSLCTTIDDHSNEIATSQHTENLVTEVLYPAEAKSLKALGVDPEEIREQPLPRDLLQLLDAANSSAKDFSTIRLNRPKDQTLVCKSSEMKRLVKECAPHLALRLAPEVPLKFSQKLPMSTRMRARKLDLSEPKRLIAAKLPTTLQSQDDTSSTLSPLRALAHAAGSYMVGTSDFFKPRESNEEAFDTLCRGSKFFPGTEQK